MVYGRKGDVEKALADCAEAIRLAPKLPLTFYSRALLYDRKGEFDKAIADFTEAIRLNPQWAAAYWGRAHVYEKTSEFDKAIADFTEAILLNPKDAEAYYNRGCTYGKRSDYDKAITDFTAAIRINPKNGYVFNSRGYSYLQKDEKAKADADFAQAEKLGYKVRSGPGSGGGLIMAQKEQYSLITIPFRLLAILWASPYTLLGLGLGMIGVCTGGRVRIRGRVIEFYGGGVKWLLQQFWFVEGALAFTLGHTILGQTDAALDISHNHEMVHVCQFERWGPLMGPAYLGCCLVLWLMRCRPYRDNPFEREAYDQGGGK
jgi:tetratricopeptide (TPR) repeat protein